MMRVAVILTTLLLLNGSCKYGRVELPDRELHPAENVQVEPITRLLLEGHRLRSVYRIRSSDHEDAWYIAGRVYGSGAIDGDVAVWFVSERPGEIKKVLSVDTMADACSYAPRETDANLNWKDEEVRQLEAYVSSRP